MIYERKYGIKLHKKFYNIKVESISDGKFMIYIWCALLIIYFRSFYYVFLASELLYRVIIIGNLLLGRIIVFFLLKNIYISELTDY